MIRLLAVIVCLFFPLHATADDLPALFDVTGVASDDTLNIRQAPDAATPVIGTLSADARNVEVTAIDEDGKWARVNSGERNGWASLRYLTRQTDQGETIASRVASCFGTEPFWTLDFEPQQRVRFAELGQSDIAGQVDDVIRSINHQDEVAVVLNFETGNNATALISRAQCNDGMSDRLFGLRISLLHHGSLGRTLMSGCCSLSN